MTKRVYLCQPYCGDIRPEASDARVTAIAGWAGLEMVDQRINDSMLCDGFNSGICYCLNGKFDYWAMLHSDHGPERGWLGYLLTYLEESGADVIHAAATIKDERYLSSTAIAYSDDIHQLKRRLSLREVFALPPTFTIEDVQRQVDPDAKILLPNPGCMAMHVRPWLEEWPGFCTYSDKRKDENGVWKPHSISEDYMFGYWCAAHGIKIACTRNVVTHHWGWKDYHTTEPRGLDTDRFYLQTIGKPNAGAGKWLFPFEVDGWLTSEEGVALAKLAAGKRVLEIGSYCGRSTICLSQTAKHVVAVDPHDGRATSKIKNTLPELLANLSRYLQTNVTVNQATSAEFAVSYSGEPFDVVFIDGAHDRASVLGDIEIAERFLSPGGLIAFHDVREYAGEHDGRWDGEVTEVVQDYLATGAALLARHGSVAIVRPPQFVGKE